MEVQEILNALEFSKDRRFPREALGPSACAPQSMSERAGDGRAEMEGGGGV